MPESEPKPKLIEQVAPGAGQGWKAVLRNGKAAVVHEIPVPQAEAVAAAPRLQRLFEHRHPALSPVLAWGTDANGVWVAVEPNEGTPLGSILARGPLTPPAAAALGAAVLSGVAALHEAGIAMGGFGATAIRVTSNGEVRMAGHPAAAVRGAPSQSDLRADVRSSGMAVCAAFGVDPAGAPAPANIPPGLVVTMRSMASGAMGPSADRAQAALREMASAMLAPDRQMASQAELATRAGGRDVPAITPFLPSGTVAPASQTPSGPVPAAAPAQAAAPAAAPAPFIAPPSREEEPIRRSVYEPVDRPLQTYPSMPAITFPPAAAAPPTAPNTPVAPATSTPSVPTWSDPPAPAAPAEPAPPAYEPAPAAITSAPAPASTDSAPAPAPAPPETPEPTAEPAVPSWQTVSPTPAAEPAPAAAFATSPPAAAEPAVKASPPTPPAEQTWTPMEQPVWKPGSAVPAEPLGFGVPVADAPVRTPTTPPVPRATAPPPSRKASVARPRLPSLPERPPWLLPAAAAAVIVILLGGIGGFVLANRGGSPTASVQTPSAHPSGSPRTSPSTQPTGGPQAVPVFAPATAGVVTKVQICTQASPCKIPGAANETGTSCDLNTRCQVEVAVYFSSVQKSVPVGYTLKFFDRCTGQTTDLPGTRTTTASTGYIVAIPADHLAAALPAGVKSGALVAVTQQPAVAASAPLLLGGTSC